MNTMLSHYAAPGILYDCYSKKQYISLLKKSICFHFKIEWSEVENKGRWGDLPIARVIFSALMKRRYKNISLKEIGSHLGARDHTTVVYHHSTMKKYIETNQIEVLDMVRRIANFQMINPIREEKQLKKKYIKVIYETPKKEKKKRPPAIYSNTNFLYA